MFYLSVKILMKTFSVLELESKGQDHRKPQPSDSKTCHLNIKNGIQNTGKCSLMKNSVLLSQDHSKYQKVMIYGANNLPSKNV